METAQLKDVEDEIKEAASKAGVLLSKNEMTLAVAESVTSGNIQAAFSLATDATTFFQGGITVYNIGQKCRHLLVEPTHAIESNCVSQKVSDQMAKNVCSMFLADYGIAITGYHSPVPELNIQDLFAYISIGKKDSVVLSEKINAAHDKPRNVQLFYALQSIRLLLKILQE